MKVQTKIFILLFLIVGTFVATLVAVRVFGQQKFRAIAAARAADRHRVFSEFLEERGDDLKVLVDDSTNWNDLVIAIRKGDTAWAEANFSEQTLATYHANAVWIYRADLSLFYSVKNRWGADNLIEAPVPMNALQKLFEKREPAHFFVHVPQGWMELRGATIHHSRDRFRQTPPDGYFLTGHIWIDENVRRMALFTGYEIQIVPAEKHTSPKVSAEEEGLITFSRALPGWDGRTVAAIEVRHDSPIIRELNRAATNLFIGLMIFAGALLLVIASALICWVRRPLRIISRNLEEQNPEGLVPLSKKPHEFGKLAQLILTFRRTEEALQNAEEQLRHSQKLEAVGRLAGGVAHDFNNLLTAIIGYSELLEHRFRNDEGSLKDVLMIKHAGERAAGLTKQLLAFSRKQLLHPRVLDLNALVRDVEMLLQRVIGEHLRIVHLLQAHDARVKADPGQLEQVILNLGVNARDAMPHGGTLTFATQNLHVDSIVQQARGLDIAIGDYVVLAVSDTGFGMDEITRARIFEPFFTTKGPGKGTGLGLATVYGIVKQSGGAITVETEEGKGSTFTIYLPHELAELDPAKPILPPVERSRCAEVVLVTEDEEVVRQLVCAVLRENGYEVLCAAVPSEALSLARARPGGIQLLVTDVVMPEMHGPALVRELTPLQPFMRVLYVSGYSDNDISAHGVIDPTLDVLQKPFTQQTLLRKIREVLDAPAAAGSGGGISTNEVIVQVAPD